MSQVIWSEARIPLNKVKNKSYPVFDGSVCIENVHEIEALDQDLTDIPDHRAYRSMSRGSLMLSSVGLKSIKILQPFLEKDPFRVGIYVALDASPEEYESVKHLPHDDDLDFVSTYKKLRSPKQYFKQLPNLAAAQLGIFLKVMGPIYTFTHLKYGCLHALDRAESDLDNDIVDATLVGSSFTFEDPLMSFYVRQGVHPTVPLCEGAGFMLLTKNDSSTDWKENLNKANYDVNYSFGIATPLISYIFHQKNDQGGNYHENRTRSFS